MAGTPTPELGTLEFGAIRMQSMVLRPWRHAIFTSPGADQFCHLKIAAEGVRQLNLPWRPAFRFEDLQ
jgi:hypothetical protein